MKRRKEDDIGIRVEDKLAKLDASNGTILAIAGNDFVLIASDNRLVIDSDNLHKHFKLFPITATTIIGSIVDLGHAISLTSLIKYRAETYEVEHNKPLTIDALLSMIKIVLYSYRFLRSFMGTLLVGLDTEGKGAVFKYVDKSGFRRCRYFAIGGACHTMLQLLEQDIEKTETLSKQRAIHIAQKCFLNAARSLVGIGNLAKLQIISKAGIEEHTFRLK